jgi:tRNA/tmRNA/rRNA uracil-C5-methylase (TrmA/RlmC/RlmD family)
LSDTFEVVAQGFGAHGTAVGNDADGRSVSIPGVIPGERVEAKALAHRRGVVHARVMQVLEPSPARVEPPCPEVAHGCGACQWQHIAPAAQVDLKQEQVRAALARADVTDPSVLQPPVVLPDQGFRTTVNAAVHRGRAGYRRYRSHRVVPVEGCLVAHPLVTELLVEGRYGDASDVLLRCGARTGERLAAPTPAGTVIDVPDDARRAHLYEEAGGRRWRISAGSFFQARPDGVDALADAVLAAAVDLEPARAVDLYAGVGVFAGVLGARGWSATAVEASTSACADAEENLRDLDASVVRADITRWSPSPCELVVADPSRAGLEHGGVDAVAASGARRVVLISCDAGSLERDTRLLARAGYEPVRATLVDLFPHTYHVEVVTTFDAVG